MPDLERLTDSLREHLAADPEQKAWARGFAAGKKQARIEVAVIVALLYFAVVIVGKLST